MFGVWPEELKMSLDLKKLENCHELPDGRRIARCPACAESGGDRKMEHLVIFPDGRFACAAHQGDSAHRKQIFKIAGLRRPDQRCEFRVTVQPKSSWKPHWGAPPAK